MPGSHLRAVSAARTSPGWRVAAHPAERLLRSLLDDFVTTVSPADCLVCHAPLVRASALPVCDECRAQVTAQRMPLCGRCGEAMDCEDGRGRPAEGLLCRSCRLASPPFERAVAYALYDGATRELIHLLKYEGMTQLAGLLGAALAEAMLTLRPMAGDDVMVVPVPLFAGGRERGYNQASLLAAAALTELRRLAPEWRLRQVNGALRRTRETRSQFELNPAARRRNLRGAFAADASLLGADAEVLLVDDIYTTGATARECARALLRAGAAKVWVATLARAQAPQVELWRPARPG